MCFPRPHPRPLQSPHLSSLSPFNPRYIRFLRPSIAAHKSTQIADSPPHLSSASPSLAFATVDPSCPSKLASTNSGESPPNLFNVSRPRHPSRSLPYIVPMSPPPICTPIPLSHVPSAGPQLPVITICPAWFKPASRTTPPWQATASTPCFSGQKNTPLWTHFWASALSHLHVFWIQNRLGWSHTWAGAPYSLHLFRRQ